MTPISVLCVDDHPLVRKGIAAMLATEPDIRLTAEAVTGREAIRLFRLHQPDVTLMDLRLPDISGAEATRAIRAEFPTARIIALTSYDGDQDVCRVIDAGARAYLLKEMVHAEIVKAIRVVHSGARFIPPAVAQIMSDYLPDFALTPREAEVLGLVARGLSNKQIGGVLGTAPGTIKAQVQSILSKLGATDRTHAVSIAIRRGILHHNPRESGTIGFRI